ncbi:MAG: DNA damage-inducible protein DinB [Chloroflexi bacterium HGW-Chloroflexi-10]|nr:MAG: DNA damage-inducible protein DinB [Chloroflexi bacterium HGW-Chloroflexi-10]
MKIIRKPNEGEYAPYAIMYIRLIFDDGMLLTHLQDNLKSTQALIHGLPVEKLAQRWAEGEWTIKEILVHMIDTERIFCYRALRFARNDATELTGFEQDDYVPYSGANERKIEEIMEEYAAVRQATITFFNSLEEEAFTRSGIVNGNRVSVRAAAWMIAGHELHHLNSIREHYL